MYRRLALKLHPDKNPGDEEAAQRFQEVSRAYNILVDPQKRKYYDEHGTVEDIDVSAEDFMGMFRALMNQMMGGLSIRDMVAGMSEEELLEMPPFPFPKELFPDGTFPAGMRFSREGLQGVPPAVEALLESSPEELGKMFQEAGDRPELEDAYGSFFPDSVEESDQYRRENSRFAGFSGMPSSSHFSGGGVGGVSSTGRGGKKGKRGAGHGPGMAGAVPSEAQMKLTDELLKSLNMGPDADIDELTELLGALDGADGDMMPPELMGMLGNLMGMGGGMEGMGGMGGMGEPPMPGMPPMGFGVPPMPAPSKSGKKKAKRGKKGGARTVGSKKASKPTPVPGPPGHAAAPGQAKTAAAATPPDVSPSARATKKSVTRPDGKLWIEAAKNGAVDMLSMLLETNYGLLDYKGPGIGHTALHWCAAKGHSDACKWLLRQDAAVNSVNSEGSSPLHAAAANGQTACVEILLNSGADPTIKDEEGCIAVQVAKQRKHADAERAIQGFHDERAGPEVRTEESVTQEKIPAANIPEENGCPGPALAPPVQAQAAEPARAADKTLLREAVRNDLEAMELVDDEMEARQRRQKLEKEAAAALVGVQKAEGREWMTAAKEGRTHDLAQMLERNPKLLHYRGEGTNFSFTGHTALHWCAAKAHAEPLLVLLEEGADPNAPNNAGSTPLHAASANGSVDCAKILIICGGTDATRLDGLGESAKDAALGKNQDWSQELASTIDLCSKADQLRREDPSNWSLRTMRSLLVMAGDKRVADYVEKSELVSAAQKVLQGMLPRVVPKREVVPLKMPEEAKGGGKPSSAQSTAEKRATPKSPTSPGRSETTAAPASAPGSTHDPLLQKSALAKERGNSAFKSGDFLKASQQYSMAIRLDPRNHVLYSNRSAAYASLQSWDRALEDGEKCVKLNPAWGKGYARKAAALVGKGLAGDGLKVYKQGLAAEPQNAACKQGIADTKVAIRRKQQQFEAATGEAFPEYSAE